MLLSPTTEDMRGIEETFLQNPFFTLPENIGYKTGIRRRDCGISNLLFWRATLGQTGRPSLFLTLIQPG